MLLLYIGHRYTSPDVPSVTVKFISTVVKKIKHQCLNIEKICPSFILFCQENIVPSFVKKKKFAYESRETVGILAVHMYMFINNFQTTNDIVCLKINSL